MAETNGNYPGTGLRLKLGLAEMLKGGVIMDVMSTEQAVIAERAGATAVMALERVPAMIRAQGGVARMAKPSLIKQIIGAVSIPVMAKARIGHFAEAQILQHLGVDFIDESEVLTPPMSFTTSTSTPSPLPSFAERAIWAKPCAASPKAQP